MIEWWEEEGGGGGAGGEEDLSTGFWIPKFPWFLDIAKFNRKLWISTKARNLCDLREKKTNETCDAHTSVYSNRALCPCAHPNSKLK